MTALNAVDEPRLMRPINTVTMAVKMTDSIGIAVFGCSLVTVLQPGSPRSRAKAHTMRDAVAMAAIEPAPDMTRVMAIMTEAPALLFVAV